VQASESITLTAGQSQIVIKGGDITFTCPGTWTVKAAAHDWGSGGSQAAQLQALPSSKTFSERFQVKDSVTGVIKPNTRYWLTVDGVTTEGMTDDQGWTHTAFSTGGPSHIVLEIEEDGLELRA